MQQLMHPILFLLFVVVTVDSLVQAQVPEGTPLWYANEYFHKSWQAATNRDVDLARHYADSARILFDVANEKQGDARYRYLLGGIARVKGDFLSALEHYAFAQEVFMEDRDTSFLASVHFQLGIVNEALGRLDDAISHQYASIQYYESENNEAHIAPGLNNLGSIYRKLKQYKQSEALYYRALEVNHKYDFLEGQATNYVNLGNLYAEQELVDSALSVYRKAVTLDSILEYDFGLAYDYENMANLYTKLGSYGEAKALHLQALEIRRRQDTQYERSVSYKQLGALYHQMGQYQTALLYLDSAAQLVQATQVLEDRRDIARYRADAFAALGQYQQAYAQEQKLNELQDTFLNREITEQINQLNTQYETERKEQEIALLNADRELAQVKLQATRRQLFGLLAGFVVVAGLLFTVFRLFRRTKVQNEVISKALQEKDILLREIHHRVKNNLQFISSLLGLQSEHIEDVSALSALQEGQDRVQSMALIHQNLYQEENLTGVDIRDYFTKLIRNLFDSYNIRPGKINLQLEVEDLNLDVDTVIPIGLIVNELVSNALKYAFPEGQGTIKVNLSEADHELRLIVRDDGKGITPEEQASVGHSFGYRLIHVFKEQLEAHLDIDGSQGTRVEMRIRKYKKTRMAAPV